jgi:hypothetical protein
MRVLPTTSAASSNGFIHLKSSEAHGKTMDQDSASSNRGVRMAGVWQVKNLSISYLVGRFRLWAS